jgi:coenzyme Q-binding protein COQ10
MATCKASRPLLHSSRRLYQPHLQKRAFLPNPFAPSSDTTPQTLTAHRILPYPSAPIYSIIADVPSYASFLPYCQRSDITHWSSPDALYHRRWPSEGKLTSGFGGITESFRSRVYCVPGRYVESVGGDTETSLSRNEIAHHLEGSEAGGGRSGGDNGLLKHLRSKWTIEDLGKDKTGVTLALEFAFANPFYAALSGGVAPKVADVMIRAFEKRVGELLVENPDMVGASLEELDGSRLKKR